MEPLDETEVNPADKFDDEVSINTGRLFPNLPAGWRVRTFVLAGRGDDPRHRYWHMFVKEDAEETQVRFTPQTAEFDENAPDDAEYRYAIRPEAHIRTADGGTEPVATGEREQAQYDYESAVEATMELLREINEGVVDTRPVL